MIAGGDLDGDLYFGIFNYDFIYINILKNSIMGLRVDILKRI
jgi:hypothetical protein